MSTLTVPSSVGRRASSRQPSSSSITDLTAQLEEIQNTYRQIQSEAQAQEQRIEVSSSHPGLPAKRVDVRHQQPQHNGTTNTLTAGELYDMKRRELSALTLEVIMTLNMSQILNLRQSFDSHGGVVSISQFVAIMASHLDMHRLKTTPDMLIRSLVELFDSMDLDGDGELEFEELLTTVVGMGMAATEHLLLTPIASYREGPQYLVSMQQIDRSILFLPEREAILVVDSGDFALRLYDPSMKHSFAVDLPISSALGVAYVSGVLPDVQQNQGSYRRSSVAKASYYTSGKPSAREERAKARAALEAATLAHTSERSGKSVKECNMWPRIAGMPLSKPMRMENGQPLAHARGGAHALNDDEGAEKSSSSSSSSSGASSASTAAGGRASSQLFSDYSAKPYYSSNASQHTFTGGASSNSGSGGGGNTTGGSGGGSNASGGGGSAGSSSSTSSSSSRTPLIFIQEDYLVTSTSQYLQIWDGFPTGPASLCDARKIRHAYSCLKWCGTLQRLFAGDVLGNIDVWKIVILPSTSSLAPPNKPSLQKERSLTGHTDIITGLESIPSMGFLLSASLDASVRMFDLQAGTEKNRFIGHRAGVVAIAYSNEYRFLLSAGSDHQVRVWSPFAEKQVFSLRGHKAPLIGVQFVPGTPQIVTADSDGWMRVWDARNFACTQVFFTIANITGFTSCSQRHKRIFVVGKSHELHIYEQEGGPFLKRRREEPIFAALYSPFTMTMLTASREDVKVWDGLTGGLSRVYRGLAESDLTAVCLDSRQRKLFVGDQAGRIRCYNYLTGAYMKSLTPHGEEIIAMAYSGAVRCETPAAAGSEHAAEQAPLT